MHRDEFGPVGKAREPMKASKPGCCGYIHRRKSNARIERESLEGFAKDTFEHHRAGHGYRRIGRELRKTGISVSGKRAH